MIFVLLLSTAFFLEPSAGKSPRLENYTEAPDVYEIVATTTVSVFPPNLQQFFDGHSETLRKHAVKVGKDEDPASPKSDEHERHYIMLDVAAESTDQTARRAAAIAFPRNRAGAKSLFDQRKRRDGGTLPWEIEDEYRELIKAFSSGDLSAVHTRAGALIHFATDAALPFNTTIDRDGKDLGRPDWCNGETAVPKSHCTLRDRFQTTLIVRIREQLSYEVRVSPARFRPTDDVLGAVFALMIESHRLIQDVADMDAEATSELRIADASHFLAVSDAYYSKLADRAAQLIEGRIEAAALLSANLIGSAWIQAGRPTIPTPPKQPDVVASTTPSNTKPTKDAESASAIQAPFAGSTNSTVFHRAGCSHLRRTKAENLVTFASIAAAKAAGRTACKACNPDE